MTDGPEGKVTALGAAVCLAKAAGAAPSEPSGSVASAGGRVGCVLVTKDGQRVRVITDRLPRSLSPRQPPAQERSGKAVSESGAGARGWVQSEVSQIVEKVSERATMLHALNFSPRNLLRAWGCHLPLPAHYLSR